MSRAVVNTVEYFIVMYPLWRYNKILAVVVGVPLGIIAALSSTEGVDGAYLHELVTGRK